MEPNNNDRFNYRKDYYIYTLSTSFARPLLLQWSRKKRIPRLSYIYICKFNRIDNSTTLIGSCGVFMGMLLFCTGIKIVRMRIELMTLRLLGVRSTNWANGLVIKFFPQPGFEPGSYGWKPYILTIWTIEEKCRLWDLNPRVRKHQGLNLTP